MKRPDLQRRHASRQRVMIVVAILIGIAALATAGTALARNAQSGQPYHYVVGKTVSPEELSALSALAEKGIAVHKATVVTSQGKTVADLKFAETQAGPVLVEWRPHVMRPFIKTLPPAEAVTKLAAVLQRHVDEGTPLLAWWDVSREFRMLTGLDVVFGQHLGIPLFVPVAWHGSRQQIRKIESHFWQASVDPQDRARFKRFVQALLAKPRQGVAELRKLVNGKPAVLVLHVRDMILLGQLAPEKIAVAFRDVAWTGDIHGMVSGTYRWLQAYDYTAYTVMQLKNDSNHQVREIALMDKASVNTLAARLLPFISHEEHVDVSGVKLVYTANGFWVYKLTPKPARVASRKDTTVEEE